MLDFKTTLLMMHVGSGLVLTALSFPLIRGKIGPNPWYGFRVRQTLENPAIWSSGQCLRWQDTPEGRDRR